MAINVEFNAIVIVVNKHINIIHAENFVKKSDLIVATIVDSIAIQLKNALNSPVKLKYLSSVNVDTDKRQYFAECHKIKNFAKKSNVTANVKT